MRRLARQMDPINPVLGTRQVINLMDAGKSLSERFGVDFATLLPECRPIGMFAGRPQSIDEAQA